MTLTIGRASGLRPTRASPVLGDRIDIEGTIVATNLAELKARRQQLIGLMRNPDEEIVPIVWSSDSTYDGFYRINSVRVQHVGATSSPVARFSVSAQRIGGYANPWFEVTTQSITRTNGHGFATPTTIIATGPAQPVSSDNVVDLYPDLGGATSSPTRLTSDGFELRCFRDLTPQSLTTFRYVARPEWFYKGAATLEVQYSGSSTWYPVVGDQHYDHGALLPGGAPISAWRISNGIIRMTSTTGFGSGASGTFEIWDNVAGAWESSSFSWSGAGGPGNLGPRALIKAPVILRNSPEQVIVRVQSSRVSETWSIQRGAHFATAHVYTPVATLYKIGMNGVAGTAITGGVREAANNASGNRMVFAVASGALTSVADTANTAVQPSASANAVSFMVGCELAGSSAATGDAAFDLTNQFFGAVQWRQRVVRQ